MATHLLPSGAAMPAHPRCTKQLRGCKLAEIREDEAASIPRGQGGG